MQLLKSLFCLKGLDNRTRFIIINFSVYTIFFITHLIFKESLTFPLILLVGLVTLAALSTLRRSKDAALNKNWPFAAPATFLLAGVVILFFDNITFAWLLIIPISISVFMTTYASRTKNDYILGYSGPVDLSEFSQSNSSKQAKHTQRIEPSLAGNSLNESVMNINIAEPSSRPQNANHSSTKHNPTSNGNNAADFGEKLRVIAVNNKKSLLIVTLLISVTAVAITAFSFVGLDENNEAKTPVNEVTPPVTIRNSRITFSDNFSILLSQYKGIIINWQADSVEKSDVWDINTAQGDKTCKEIVFNNGTKFRTLSVTAENSSDYFANFSPLDTKRLLKEVAFRGKFSLCGYSFALKGSQATLGKHSDYANMIDY